MQTNNTLTHTLQPLQLHKNASQQTQPQHASSAWILDKALVSRLPVLLLLWSTFLLLTGCDVPGTLTSPSNEPFTPPTQSENQFCMLIEDHLTEESDDVTFQQFFVERGAEVIWKRLHDYLDNSAIFPDIDASIMDADMNEVLSQQGQHAKATMRNAIALYIARKQEEATFRHFLFAHRLDPVWDKLNQAKDQDTLDLSQMLYNAEPLVQTHVLKGVVQFICNYASSVVVLDLSRNRLTGLPDSFERLTQLQELRLDDNHLQVLPGCLEKLTTTHCTLIGNFVDASDELFQRFLFRHGLHGIWEMVNKAKEKRKDTLDLTAMLRRTADPAVKTLALDGLCQFIDRHLPNLIILDLSHNQLTQLPDNLGFLTQLQKLHLQHNQLMALPKSFVNLTQLNELNLSDNQLIQLPACLQKLTKLRGLQLSMNQLTQLPAWLADLTQLQLLDLSVNQLTQLPACLENFTQLQLLDLSGNQLRFLPGYLQKLTNLRDFSVYNNPLVQPNADITEISQIGVQLTADNLGAHLHPSLCDLAGEIIVRKHVNYETEPIPQDCINAIQNPKTYRVMVFTTQLGHLTLRQTVPIITHLSYQEIRGLVHSGTKVILMN